MAVDDMIAQQLRELPKEPGVYLFKDGTGDVLYVGKAKNLYNRVRSYFNPRAVRQDGRIKIQAMVNWIRRIETIVVKTEAEALILEGRLLKEYKPKYNTSFVDDKRFLLIRVDGERMPRFHLCRNRVDEKSVYYGPFVHGPLVRKIYYELRRRYGVLLSDVRPKEREDGRYDLYDDARAEIFEHANTVTREEYVERVTKACAFLDGQSRQWKEEVVNKMQEAAAAQDYEGAAKWRDMLEALSHAKNPERKFLRDPLMRILEPQKAMGALQEALGMAQPPKEIECFDISHISGSYVVASMVHFTEGKPNKRQYKRFKIRNEEGQNALTVGNDDFYAMQQVVGRHYGRLAAEGKALPDLIVIDGGAGQLRSAFAAFIDAGVAPIPLMIGLAKREESFIFSDGRPPMTLERTHEGLRLLQRLRDEAHRVANGFNAEWRSKQLKATILDDCPGLGPKRKTLLLEHFGSIERMKKATITDLGCVEGMGVKRAQLVYEFLKGKGE